MTKSELNAGFYTNHIQCCAFFFWSPYPRQVAVADLESHRVECAERQREAAERELQAKEQRRQQRAALRQAQQQVSIYICVHR